MTARYTVTFETTDDAKSLRGEVSASNSSTLVARAVSAAKRQAPRSQWGSLVVVVERLERATAEDEPAEAAGEGHAEPEAHVDG